MYHITCEAFFLAKGVDMSCLQRSQQAASCSTSDGRGDRWTPERDMFAAQLGSFLICDCSFACVNLKVDCLENMGFWPSVTSCYRVSNQFVDPHPREAPEPPLARRLNSTNTKMSNVLTARKKVWVDLDSPLDSQSSYFSKKWIENGSFLPNAN